jgi:hypothetical protein
MKYNETTIKNYDELVDSLAQRMMQANIDCNQYETDVYLYVKKDGTWELYDFINVGGNSWLDDDHITVWIDKSHYDNYFDWYTNINEIAEVLDITVNELQKTVYDYMFPEGNSWFEVNDVDYTEICKCIRDRATETTKKWDDALFEAFKDCVESNFQAYVDMARDQIDSTFEELNKYEEEN